MSKITNHLRTFAIAVLILLTGSAFAARQSQQMVELNTVCGGDVEWFVNGARVVPAHDGRFFWQLVTGEWNVRAVSRQKFAEQKITVEAMSH